MDGYNIKSESFHFFNRWCLRDTITTPPKPTLLSTTGLLLTAERNHLSNVHPTNTNVRRRNSVFRRMIFVTTNEIVVMVLMKMSIQSVKDTPSEFVIKLNFLSEFFKLSQKPMHRHIYFLPTKLGFSLLNSQSDSSISGFWGVLN